MHDAKSGKDFKDLSKFNYKCAKDFWISRKCSIKLLVLNIINSFTFIKFSFYFC